MWVSGQTVYDGGLSRPRCGFESRLARRQFHSGPAGFQPKVRGTAVHLGSLTGVCSRPERAGEPVREWSGRTRTQPVKSAPREGPDWHVPNQNCRPIDAPWGSQTAHGVHIPETVVQIHGAQFAPLGRTRNARPVRPCWTVSHLRGGWRPGIRPTPNLRAAGKPRRCARLLTWSGAVRFRGGPLGLEQSPKSRSVSSGISGRSASSGQVTHRSEGAAKGSQRRLGATPLKAAS